MNNGAIISECGRYRYLLWRQWGFGGSCATFLMLNPSTANEAVDDPTIRKCIGFAKQWGMSGLRVVNLFAFRATDPNMLAKHDHSIVGPDNDTHLVAEFARAGLIVCAWGSTGNAATKRLVRERLRVVQPMLVRAPLGAVCLGRAADGNPRHPLMLAYKTPRESWESDDCRRLPA